MGQHKLVPRHHLHLPLSLLWLRERMREGGQELLPLSFLTLSLKTLNNGLLLWLIEQNKNGTGLNVMIQPSVE